jgi:hypothetical protein
MAQAETLAGARRIIFAGVAGVWRDGVVGNGVNFAEFWVSLGQEFGKTFLWV